MRLGRMLSSSDFSRHLLHDQWKARHAEHHVARAPRDRGDAAAAARRFVEHRGIARRPDAVLRSAAGGSEYLESRAVEGRTIDAGRGRETHLTPAVTRAGRDG